jgi:hypothetical protein
MFIGAVLLAREALAHSGVGEAFVNGAVCLEGEVENAGAGLLFPGVELHRVNYNNKMQMIIPLPAGSRPKLPSGRILDETGKPIIISGNPP